MIPDVYETSVLESVGDGLCYGEFVTVAAVEEEREVNKLSKARLAPFTLSWLEAIIPTGMKRESSETAAIGDMLVNANSDTRYPDGSSALIAPKYCHRAAEAGVLCHPRALGG